MALAYLFSEFYKTFPGIRVGNYPILPLTATIIDHGLRPGSQLEAQQTFKTVSKMGVRGHVRTLKWKDLREQGVEPSELPNIESIARKLRYWWLGIVCRELLSPFLFTAHHRDDQYETVLMRLLSGHTYRGLQGMRAANDIPETEGLYGVHKSGLLQDQKSSSPTISLRPTLKQTRDLRNILRDEIAPERAAYQWEPVSARLFHDGIAPAKARAVPYLTPLDTEDGGVTVYRPLLEFDKDRLRATCEANNVSWIEDQTNEDETMTMRNAVRHLVKYYNLPLALQKPSILALRERSQKRLSLEESEARRLLVRGAVARSFDPCAGTLIIEVPRFSTRRRPFRSRGNEDARAEIRRPRQRFVAALAIRNLVDFVTSDKNLPTLSTLNIAVDRLFPELTAGHDARSRPVAFSISNVLFEPVIRPDSVKWYLSRAPYKSTAPVPQVLHIRGRFDSRPFSAEEEEPPTGVFDGGKVIKKRRKRVGSHGWCDWTVPQLWDGRYWISFSSCVSDRFLIRPYTPELARAFRASLGPKQRGRLEKLLKNYAPGKVRTTLPALCRSDTDTRDAHPRLTMLALPTLGIQVPGLDRWIKCDVSYKKVDTTLLGRHKRGAPRRLIGYRAVLGLSRSRRLWRMRNGSREVRQSRARVVPDGLR